MLRGIVLSVFLYTAVMCYPHLFETRNFKVGIEYDRSLPMSGGSDRFRHRNNYEPFFVTITASAKKGYVISYLEVSATTDASGEVNFELIRGQTGSYHMLFQLISNHSDFLSYSYLAYGIREEDYKKLANIITLPITNKGITEGFNQTTVLLCLLFVLFNIK